MVTCSADGIVKIWQRSSTTGLPSSIEFAKSFRAHTGPVSSAALSQDGTYLATISHSDTTVKIFDLPALDMVSLVKISEKHGLGPVGKVAWLGGSSFVVTGAESKVALRWDSFDKSPKKFELGGVISALAYSGETLVASYEDGSIRYLDEQFKDISPDPDTTHLLDCHSSSDDNPAKIFSVKFSEDGRFFVVSCSDRQLRIYRMATGKLYRKYDESLQVYNQLQSSGKLAVPLDDMEFGKRMVVERDLDKNQAPFDAVFDESGTFLLYSTILGVKVLNLLTNKVSLYLGASENIRFTSLALLKPSPDTVKNLELAASEHKTARKAEEPLLALAAYKKNRFYLIGREEPDSHMDRDVMNEKATKDDAVVKSKVALPTQAIMRTTLGDIVIKLLPEVAPLAVENFITHSKNGYYDNLIFHRIIKGFMVQTGDPFGDGTGGESIWGADFRDEISPDVKHDQPFTVSMANAGPGTNGSQFFITTVKCPWLDGKHTVFGRVVRGTEVVSKIEAAETDDLDKPKSDIKIIQIDTLS